jgi:magnesium transporter
MTTSGARGATRHKVAPGGECTVGPVAISVCAYRPGTGGEQVDDPNRISEVRGRDGCLLWVDMVDPTETELKHVGDEFELHPLAMEDAKEHGQRPKIEQYPTHAFVVAYFNPTGEVDLFVGPDWLVTVRDRDEAGGVWSLDGVRARFERTRVEDTSVGHLLYVVLDEIVDGYFDVVDEAEARLEVLEERIFDEQAQDERGLQRELLTVRRELLQFRRRVVPLREVISALLRKEVPWLNDATLLHFQDVYDHVLRATDLLDEQRELLGNVVEAQLAIVSNRMNRVMKTMTSWGALLLGSTLVAGIYGMNFEHMPELGWKLGYPFALGVMATMTIVGYRLFKRRDWL